MRKFQNLQFIHTIFDHFCPIFALFRLRVGWHPVYRQNRTFPFCPRNEHPDPQKSFDSKRKSPQHRCCGLDWRRWGDGGCVRDIACPWGINHFYCTKWLLWQPRRFLPANLRGLPVCRLAAIKKKANIFPQQSEVQIPLHWHYICMEYIPVFCIFYYFHF